MYRLSGSGATMGGLIERSKRENPEIERGREGPREISFNSFSCYSSKSKEG